MRALTRISTESHTNCQGNEIRIVKIDHKLEEIQPDLRCTHFLSGIPAHGKRKDYKKKYILLTPYQAKKTSPIRMVRRDMVTQAFESLTICEAAGPQYCKRYTAGLT